MADYTKRTVRSECVEFMLPNPTNWGELGKALRAAHQELSGGTGIESWPDDVVTVHANEEEIVLRCQAKTEVNTRTVKVTWADDAVERALGRLIACRNRTTNTQLDPSEQAIDIAIDALRATIGYS